MKLAQVGKLKAAFVLSIASLIAVTEASALPFNDDMVDVQKRTGTIMRQKAPGTVAIGMSDYYVASREEAEKMTNPVKADAKSVAKGKRLFAVNCLPCHGDISKKPYAPGAVGAKTIQTPPDLTSVTYHPPVAGGDATQGRTDASIYATIHFGIRLMPGHGWKLSPTDHWDIVNYIRSQQGIK